MEDKIVLYRTGPEVRKRMASALEQRGLDSRFAENEQELLDYLEQGGIGLVIMELRGEPAETEELVRLRGRSNVPVIIVARGCCGDVSQESSVSRYNLEQAKLAAFGAGADDYIMEDCSLPELLARIEVQLRRYRQLSHTCSSQENVYRIGELIINDDDKSVTIHGRKVNLTPVEYKILKLLVQEQGKVISIPQIYEAIWHMKAVGVDNTIAVHICHIREKIERNPRKPQYVKVVWGTGYKVG